LFFSGAVLRGRGNVLNAIRIVDESAPLKNKKKGWVRVRFYKQVTTNVVETAKQSKVWYPRERCGMPDPAFADEKLESRYLVSYHNLMV
jgi:hypothetical protein